MQTRLSSVSLLLALITLTAATSSAQGPFNRGQRRYDPATETTLSGSVQTIEISTQGRRAGVHLTLDTETGLEVHLGPQFYLEENAFELAQGDWVEITGSRVTLQGVEVLIAREVVKNGETLTLRDEQGRPQWSRAGQGRRCGCCQRASACRGQGRTCGS